MCIRSPTPDRKKQMGNQQCGADTEVSFTQEDIAALPDKSIAFIKRDDAGNFTVAEEAKAALRAIGAGKICVIAVTGPSRSGKSALANFILERQEGFEVGSLISRCTHGINMWGRPRRATLPNGDMCWVVVLDSEGLGTDDDVQLFSLVCLLSSTIIYNSLGAIDEKAINALSFVAQLARAVRINPREDVDEDEQEEDGAEQNEEAGEEEAEDYDDTEAEAMQFRSHFPNFCWVLRDFALELTDVYGEPITPDKYLELSLQSSVGFDEGTLERNQIRTSITSFFGDRKCFTLCRPLTSEKEMQTLDRIPRANLRREFREGLQELKEYLYFHHMRPKAGPNDVYLNGASFIALTEQYVAAMASGRVPTVRTAYESVLRDECEIKFEEALQAYDSLMQSLIAMDVQRRFPAKLHGEGNDSSALVGAVDVQILVSSHAAAVKKALTVFQSSARGDMAAGFSARLEATLGERLVRHQKKNTQISEKVCSEIILEMYGALVQPKLSSGAYLDATAAGQTGGYFAGLQADVSSIVSNYRASPLVAGPAKEAVLVSFFEKQVMRVIRQITIETEKRHEDEVLNHTTTLKRTQALLHATTAREQLRSSSQGAAESSAVELKVALQLAEASQKSAEERAQRLAADLEAERARSAGLATDLQEANESLESERHWQTAISEKLEAFQVAYEGKDSDYKALYAEHKSNKSMLQSQLVKMQARLDYLEAENTLRAEARRNLDKTLARAGNSVHARRSEKHRQSHSRRLTTPGKVDPPLRSRTAGEVDSLLAAVQQQQQQQQRSRSRKPTTPTRD